MICSVCQANHVYPSHRRGLLERGPLTWIAVLPFRCGLCQTRFYRFNRRDLRHRWSGINSGVFPEKLRAPRWATNVPAVVTVTTPGEAGTVLEGRAENASADGAQVRLPAALAEGSRVSVSLEGDRVRTGTIRWSEPQGRSGVLHGIRFDDSAERRSRHVRPLRRLRLRRMLRRGLIAIIGLLAIAVAAYGTVWLVEGMWSYNPKYYEPKDVEREVHDARQLAEEKKGPSRP